MKPESYPPRPRPRRAGAPAPLVVAASLVAVEAMLLVLQGAAEMVALSGSRVTMGVTTGVFFMVYGVGLGICAWALTKLRSWARAPVVVAQLIQLLVAWSFWGDQTMPFALAMIIAAVLVLLGIFHPASMEALSDENATETSLDD